MTSRVENGNTPLFALADRIEVRPSAAQRQVDAQKRLQAGIAAGLDALLPALRNRAFKREW